jgi:predicted nucleic acid binding AN1-type Zn finger protein
MYVWKKTSIFSFLIINLVKMKCDKCKKTKLIILSCRCGKNYCQKHLLPEKHYCNYNYKEEKIKLQGIKEQKIENKL